MAPKKKNPYVKVTKTYLGEGVYVSKTSSGIKLETIVGTVYLSPAVYSELVVYWKEKVNV